MASKDPFEDVLKALGLYEDVQKIPPAVVEAQGRPQHVSCRVDVMDAGGNAAAIQQAPAEVRLCWALKLVKFVHSASEAASPTRVTNVTLILDGTVRVGCAVAGEDTNGYLAEYRIPTSTIKDLPLREQLWRAKKFALGILLYEIFIGQKPFEELDGDQVQDKYSKAEFPQELDSVQLLCFQSLIYACWSAEFGRYITLSKFQQYVADNPMRFSLQVASGVVGVAALITVPVLGAVGFGALGPVAGSAAAAWQASIGAVEAGSLFAICQGAAMGSAAATGLAITGATGLAITGATSGAAAMAASENLRSIFIQKCRKAA